MNTFKLNTGTDCTRPIVRHYRHRKQTEIELTQYLGTSVGHLTKLAHG